MKRLFHVLILLVVMVGLFSYPVIAADNPIAGEWVWTSKEMLNVLLVDSEKDGEFSGTFRNSSKGVWMLFSLSHGRISGGKIDFILYSLHPDGCGGATVSGGLVKSGEMVLIFSPSPSTLACSSAGKPFTVVFKRNTTAVNNSQSPVGGGPMGEVVDKGGPLVGGGPIN